MKNKKKLKNFDDLFKIHKKFNYLKMIKIFEYVVIQIKYFNNEYHFK